MYAVKSFKPFKNFLLLLVWLLPSLNFAGDCKLAGVGFPDMNSDQEKVLIKFGAKCTQASGAATDSAIPRFGQKGIILVNGKATSFLDLASEDPIKNMGKEVVVYGYLSYFTETDPFKAWGYRFDVSVFEGEWLANIKEMNSSDPQIDIVVVPDKSKNYPEPLTDSLAKLRKDNFKALTMAKSGKALVKIVGKTGVYSNTGGFYIQAETVELVR